MLLTALAHLTLIGHSIPSIAFGTWKLGNGQPTIDKVDQAISAGFDHIGTCTYPNNSQYMSLTEKTDTAQAYRNETEAGKALRDSGLARKDVYITTKFSGTDGAEIETSIKDSLKNVRCSCYTLYIYFADLLTRWTI